MIECIIVIEDKKEEQEAALSAIRASLYYDFQELPERTTFLLDFPVSFKRTDGTGGLMVNFASNMHVAEQRLSFMREIFETNRKDQVKIGVLTDLMFPASEGNKEEPNGFGVIALCVESGLPVVVCSDTNHHHVSWARPLFSMLAKVHPSGEIPVILDKKDWVKAVALLRAKLA